MIQFLGILGFLYVSSDAGTIPPDANGKIALNQTDSNKQYSRDNLYKELLKQEVVEEAVKLQYLELKDNYDTAITAARVYSSNHDEVEMDDLNFVSCMANCTSNPACIGFYFHRDENREVNECLNDFTSLDEPLRLEPSDHRPANFYVKQDTKPKIRIDDRSKAEDKIMITLPIMLEKGRNSDNQYVNGLYIIDKDYSIDLNMKPKYYRTSPQNPVGIKMYILEHKCGAWIFHSSKEDNLNDIDITKNTENIKVYMKSNAAHPFLIDWDDENDDGEWYERDQAKSVSKLNFDWNQCEYNSTYIDELGTSFTKISWKKEQKTKWRMKIEVEDGYTTVVHSITDNLRVNWTYDLSDDDVVSNDLRNCLRVDYTDTPIIENVCDPCYGIDVKTGNPKEEERDEILRCALGCIDALYYDRLTSNHSICDEKEQCSLEAFYPGYSDPENMAIMSECADIWQKPNNRLFIKRVILSDQFPIGEILNYAICMGFCSIIIMIVCFLYQWRGPKILENICSKTANQKWDLFCSLFPFMMHFLPEMADTILDVLYFGKMDNFVTLVHPHNLTITLMATFLFLTLFKDWYCYRQSVRIYYLYTKQAEVKPHSAERIRSTL